MQSMTFSDNLGVNPWNHPCSHASSPGSKPIALPRPRTKPRLAPVAGVLIKGTMPRDYWVLIVIRLWLSVYSFFGGDFFTCFIICIIMIHHCGCLHFIICCLHWIYAMLFPMLLKFAMHKLLVKQHPAKNYCADSTNAGKLLFLQRTATCMHSNRNVVLWKWSMTSLSAS